MASARRLSRQVYRETRVKFDFQQLFFDGSPAEIDASSSSLEENYPTTFCALFAFPLGWLKFLSGSLPVSSHIRYSSIVFPMSQRTELGKRRRENRTDSSHSQFVVSTPNFGSSNRSSTWHELGIVKRLIWTSGWASIRLRFDGRKTVVTKLLYIDIWSSRA